MMQLVTVAESIKWDATINLGTILTGFGIIIGVSGIAWRFFGKIELTMLAHKKDAESMKSDVTELKNDVREMKPQLAQVLALQVSSEDQNRRLTRLEDQAFGKK